MATNPSLAASAHGAAGVSHNDMANAIRALAMDAVEAAKSGHPGMPMGMADVATVLYTRFLKYDPRNPEWPDRDRFVLSAGHGSMLLYSLLYLTGFDMPLDELKRFRQLHSKTPGHPEVDHARGIETTTGPLGQGIATAVGMALAERLLNHRFGDVVDHYTYVLASDGDLMEGVSHEAASLAGHLCLNRMIVLWDDNRISIDGPTDLSFTDDTLTRFRAYGWHTDSVDGHDAEAVARAIAAAQKSDKPTIISCRTTIGYGAPTKANTAGAHGSPLGAEEIKGVREKLGWPHEPFVVPDAILGAWRAAGARSQAAHDAWVQRHDAMDPGTRELFDRAYWGELPTALPGWIDEFKRKITEGKPSVATRVASGQVLDVLFPAMPELIGGSADLSPSNNTRTKGTLAVQKEKYEGRYIHFGVREHAMAAAMNGLALHGGFIPYGGTFLTFADYSRPAIRLSALMKQRVVHIMTHDSIGLGEDGPTHQPIEHLAALRAIPNLLVLRPADAVETAECWQIALESRGTPSLIALTRQNLPTVRTSHTEANLSAKGGYVLAEADGKARVTVFATGSEVHLALEARDRLQAQGIGTRVVSMPCWELFDRQDADYRASVVDRSTVRIAIEAASPFGWQKYVGEDGTIIGIDRFGESAPAPDLYDFFGITADAVVEAAKAKV